MRTITTAAELQAYIEQQEAPPPKRGEKLTAYQRERLALDRERLEIQRSKNQAPHGESHNPELFAIVASLVACLPPLLMLFVLLLL